MNYILRYRRMLLVLICLGMLVIVSACGASGEPVVTPKVNVGEQIAQPTPSENPFPLHHNAMSKSAP